MSWLQLDPESIAQRAKARGPVLPLPTLAASVMRGALGFAVVSVAGFAPWALAGRWFHRTTGEMGMYAACAVVFIGLSGMLLHRLMVGPGTLGRFYLLFSLAFGTYALGWTVGWMSLRGHLGGLVGLFAGTTAMGWILVRAFDAPSALVQVIAALFVGNAVGYFAGGWVEAGVAAMKGIHLLGFTLHGAARLTLAMLLWGACYGLGFGAGLGFAFYSCQTKVRALLQAQ